MLNIECAINDLKDAPEKFNLRNSFFAELTLNDRLPQIIDKLMLNEDVGAKSWVRLSDLRNKIINRELAEPLEIIPDKYEDNWKIVNEKVDNWLSPDFLLIEYYFYLKILELTGFWFRVGDPNSDRLNYEDYNVDPFYFAKRSIFDEKHKNDWVKVNDICEEIHEIKKFDSPRKRGEFRSLLNKLIKSSTENNLGDLSQLLVNGEDVSGAERMYTWGCSHVNKLVDDITMLGVGAEVHFITDNAQFELVYDTLLIYFMYYVLDVKISIWVRNVPVFVSDVTFTDVRCLKEFLSNHDENFGLNNLKELCNMYDSEAVSLVSHADLDSHKCFHEYSSDVIDGWNKSDLIIIKGDLNYRKLVTDRVWEPKKKLYKNDDMKANIYCLRAVKSEAIANLDYDDSDVLNSECRINLTYRDGFTKALKSAVYDPEINFPLMVQKFGCQQCSEK